jgi:hypothetical protein
MDYLTKEEAQELITNALKQGLGELSQQLSRQLEAATDRFGEVVESRSTNWLDALIEEADSLEGNGEDYSYKDHEGGGQEFDFYSSEGGEDVGYRDLERQLIELKRANEKLQTQWQTAEQQRQEVEQQQREAAMMGSAIESIQKTGRVTSPQDLLQLLKVRGAVVEKDNQLVMKGKDPYGDVYTPLTDSLDSLLGGDYAHFAVARGGTGTGASPSSGAPISNSGGMKYFDPNGKAKVDPGQAIASDRAGYFAELAQVQKAQGQAR